MDAEGDSVRQLRYRQNCFRWTEGETLRKGTVDSIDVAWRKTALVPRQRIGARVELPQTQSCVMTDDLDHS